MGFIEVFPYNSFVECVLRPQFNPLVQMRTNIVKPFLWLGKKYYQHEL